MKEYIRQPIAGLLASGILLTGILGAMVVDRMLLLRNGHEIVLPIRPVDPRDLFKGDFARLGYDISRLDARLASSLGDEQREQLSAIVAVDGKSRTAIKGLLIDGKRVYDEPLL